MPADVLCFGAHPDDVEWGAGGILLRLKKRGVPFAIVDLTAGEMGSRGTPQERAIEAKVASDFLGAQARECLHLPDCGLMDNPESRQVIARSIRKWQPKIVLAPFWEDRHPDHSAAGLMVKNSSLYAGLAKLKEGWDAPHKPAIFLFYLLHHYTKPTFVVDISDVYAAKLQALRLHESQFAKTADQLGIISHGVSDYLYGLESRDRHFGSLIGVRHGEALVTDKPLPLLGIADLLALA